MFLLPVVFLLFCQKIKGENCGRIRLPSRSFSHCITAKALEVVGYNNRTLSAINNLTIIAPDSNSTIKHEFLIQIENNQFLEYEEGTFLPNLTKIVSNLEKEQLMILIRRNPHLCLPEREVARLKELAKGNAEIQKCSCFTNETRENEGTPRIFGGEDCIEVNGDVKFGKNFSLTERIKKQFENVVRIRGNLWIEDTELEDLSFLFSLREVVSNDSAHASITVVNNSRLRTIRLPHIQSIKNLSPNNSVLLRTRNNPWLRISIDERNEFWKIATKSGYSEQLQINISEQECATNMPFLTHTEKYAHCWRYTGDVVIGKEIDSWERDDLLKSISAATVFGCLTIKNIQMVKLDIFPALREINCKKDRPAIVIEDNPRLKWIDWQVFTVKTINGQPAYSIKNNPRLCQPEVDVLRLALIGGNSSAREVVFDREGMPCFHPKDIPDPGWIYYLVLVGVLAFTKLALIGISALRNRNADR